MRKRLEREDQRSCFNKASEDEMVFVLLARDAAAPAAINAWVEERIRLGKNKPDDPQIIEAGKCVDEMRLFLAAYPWLKLSLKK
jgi:hypothetical protein